MLDLVAMGLSPTHWLIVILIVLLLFGGSRIPEMMKGLGSGIKEFKKGLQEGEDEESDTKR